MPLHQSSVNDTDSQDFPIKPIHSVSDLIGHKDPSLLQLPKFSPDELTGCTFICKMDDGQKHHATIVQKILDKDAENH